MNEHSSVGLFGLLHEINYIIKTALDVFPDVIFEMERQILDVLVSVVIRAVVCCTVHHVRDLVLLQQVVVSGNHVAAQVEETVQNFRTDAIENGLFVLVS